MAADNGQKPSNVAEENVRVLIVAGKPRNLVNTQNFLVRRNWPTKTVSTIKDALAVVSKDKPTHVLLSWNLPNTNILKMEKILTGTFNVTCILYAESGDAQVFAKMSAAPVKHVILGPISGPAVQMKIRKIIREGDDGGAEEKSSKGRTIQERGAVEQKKKRTRKRVTAQKDEIPPGGRWEQIEGDDGAGNATWKYIPPEGVAAPQTPLIFQGTKPPEQTAEGKWQFAAESGTLSREIEPAPTGEVEESADNSSAESTDQSWQASKKKKARTVARQEQDEGDWSSKPLDDNAAIEETSEADDGWNSPPAEVAAQKPQGPSEGDWGAAESETNSTEAQESSGENTEGNWDAPSEKEAPTDEPEEAAEKGAWYDNLDNSEGWKGRKKKKGYVLESKAVEKKKTRSFATGKTTNDPLAGDSGYWGGPTEDTSSTESGPAYMPDATTSQSGGGPVGYVPSESSEGYEAKGPAYMPGSSGEKPDTSSPGYFPQQENNGESGWNQGGYLPGESKSQDGVGAAYVPTQDNSNDGGSSDVTQEGGPQGEGFSISQEGPSANQHSITQEGLQSRESMILAPRAKGPSLKNKQERHTVLAESAFQALKEACEATEGDVRPLGGTRRVGIIPVSSSRFRGLLVFAAGENMELDHAFMSKVRTRLKHYLGEKGEDFNDTGEFVAQIDQVDFAPWAEEFADFIALGQNAGDEVAMAFFEASDVDPTVSTSAEAHMVAIELKDILPEVVLTFDLFLRLPVNRKYIKYIRYGEFLSLKQMEKLRRFKISQVHIRVEEVDRFRAYCAANFINFRIKSSAPKSRAA